MNELQEFWNEIRLVWERGVFGVEIDSILLAIGIFLIFVILRGIFTKIVIASLSRLTQRTETTVDDQILEAMRGPLRFTFIVAGLFFASRVAPLPEAVDDYVVKIIRSLIAFTIFWAIYRMAVPLSFLLDTAMNAMRGQDLGEALKKFAIRVFRVIIVVLGVAAILEEWDFDIAAVLGGLGLVGMAVAFGAQNLIANLFGGLVIFLDKIFVEGHWIRSNDVEGTVEKIGFRTTKIRRFDKALVTVPNSTLADEAVTNFSMMTNRRIYWMIGVEYRTTQEQLIQIVEGINDYVRNGEDFETDPNRVSTLIHVDSFNDSSIDIMLYCFTKTTKWAVWMEVKERLLYHIKELVEEAGTGFAFPSSSLYVETVPFGKPEAVPSGNAENEEPSSSGDLPERPSASEKRNPEKLSDSSSGSGSRSASVGRGPSPSENAESDGEASSAHHTGPGSESGDDGEGER
ncbi:mechanosensitive ion channel family protein [Minwuia sp.]|uniref:mechanosensitive ion channel family protein n=1 Tax=Minwuia sp. TaxID=2493630 RepID=UPI003A8DE66F